MLNLDMNSDINIIPVWEIISTNYNVFNPVRNPMKDWSNYRFRRGTYKFIIVAVSDNQAEIIKVPLKYRNVLENMQNMKVSEFIKFTRPFLDEQSSIRLLKKLIRLNMVELKVA